MHRKGRGRNRVTTNNGRCIQHIVEPDLAIVTRLAVASLRASRAPIPRLQLGRQTGQLDVRRKKMRDKVMPTLCDRSCEQYAEVARGIGSELETEQPIQNA